MKKRILSALLALILCFGAVTVTACAADEPVSEPETTEALPSEIQTETPDSIAYPRVCGTPDVMVEQFLAFSEQISNILKNPVIKVLVLPALSVLLSGRMVMDIAQGEDIAEVIFSYIDLWLLFLTN